MGLEAQFIQEHDGIAIPSHEQRLGRLAGDGPALEMGIEVGCGVYAQHEDAEWAAGVRLVKNGDQDRQVDPLIVLIAVEILEAHLA